MRKVIRASKGGASEVARVIGVLEKEHISKDEILDYFLDRLTSDEAFDILKDFADISGIDLYESVNSSRQLTYSDSARARRELEKMDPEKVEYVRKCYNDVLSEYTNSYQWDEDDWDIHSVNVGAIKTDWLIGAIEDELMDEDEFNQIYDLLETAGAEEAATYS